MKTASVRWITMLESWFHAEFGVNRFAKKPEYILRKLVLLIFASMYWQGTSCLPIVSNDTENLRDSSSRPYLIRRALEAGLLGRTYDFSLCSEYIQLYLGTKRINRRNLRLTSWDAAEVVKYLHGETIEERMEVWCKTALLTSLISGDRGQNVIDFQVKDMEFWEGDMLVTNDWLDNLISSYRTPYVPSLTPPPRKKRGGLKLWREAAKAETVHIRQKRQIISGSDYEWPNETVPWTFHPTSNFSAVEKHGIRAGISAWEENTCLEFPELKNPSVDHLRIIKGLACSSSVGRLKTGYVGQMVSLGKGCTDSMGTVVHILGHALGLFHEHSRPDRDQYVEINTRNIGFSILGQFAKLVESRIKFPPSTVYDYGSVMHYPEKAFSKNPSSPEPTIKARFPYMYMEKTMGQREGLSFFDTKGVNFNSCSRRCNQSSLEWSKCKRGGYRNPRNCSECKCQVGFSPPYCEEMAKYGNVECGNQILLATQKMQRIKSPGYDYDKHPPNSGCAWLIRAPPGRVVEFRFVGNFSMQLPSPIIGLPCEVGYVEIRYLDVVCNGPRFCIDTPNTTITSEGPEFFVRTRVGRTSVKGFIADFRAVEPSGPTTGVSEQIPTTLEGTGEPHGHVTASVKQTTTTPKPTVEPSGPTTDVSGQIPTTLKRTGETHGHVTASVKQTTTTPKPTVEPSGPTTEVSGQLPTNLKRTGEPQGHVTTSVEQTTTTPKPTVQISNNTDCGGCGSYPRQIERPCVICSYRKPLNPSRCVLSFIDCCEGYILKGKVCIRQAGLG